MNNINVTSFNQSGGITAAQYNGTLVTCSETMSMGGGNLIVRGEDIRDYHQHEGISNSGLALMAKSPSHYFDKYLAEDKEPFDSIGLKIGRLAHVVLLQPELVDKEYNILPCDSVAKLESDEWKEYIKSPQFNVDHWKITAKQAAYIGDPEDKRERIHVADYMEVVKMISTLKKDPQIQALLTDGEAEVSFYQQDGKYVKRCRADYWRNDGVIIDYKSVAGNTFMGASADDFQRIAVRLGYHRAAPWYSDIIEKVSGKPVTGFVFIVQEKVRPYAFGVYCLRPDFIEAGRKKVNEHYELWKSCMESGDWPGYTKGIVEIAKPSWI